MALNFTILQKHNFVKFSQDGIHGGRKYLKENPCFMYNIAKMVLSADHTQHDCI